MGVDHRQPIGDHGSRSDITEKRGIVLLGGPKIGAGLNDLVEFVANGLQVGGDQRAVSEECIQKSGVAESAHHLKDKVADPKKAVDLSGFDKEIIDPRPEQDCDDGHGNAQDEQARSEGKEVGEEA